MAAVRRGFRPESEVLLRQLDSHLAKLRAGSAALPGPDLDVAERMADALRRLVADTGRANAVERARVRAAVHYFVSRGTRGPLPGRYASHPSGTHSPGAERRNEIRRTRTVDDDLRVVNDILRADLLRGPGGGDTVPC